MEVIWAAFWGVTSCSDSFLVSEEPSGCKSKPDTKASEKPTAPIINVDEFSIYSNLERT